MKFNKLLTLSTLFLSGFIFSAAYDEDEREIYIQDDQVEEQLAEINVILCTLGNTMMEQFADKGPYKATVFPSRCEAKDTSSNQGGNQAQQGQQAEVEVPSNMVLDVVSKQDESTNDTYLEAKIWFTLKGDYSTAMETYPHNSEPDTLVYTLVKVYAGATESDPNGDLEVAYTATSLCEGGVQGTQDDWKCPQVGSYAKQGIISTLGNQVTLKTWGETLVMQTNDSAEGASSVTLRDGVFIRTGGLCIDTDGTEIDHPQSEAVCWQPGGENYDYSKRKKLNLTYGFSFDEGKDIYCQKLLNVTYNTAPEGQPEIQDGDFFALLPSLTLNEWSAKQYNRDEKCNSTKESDAKLNIWEYGLYTEAGDRLELAKPGFELKGTITVDEKEKDVRAWADYWGTWLDPKFRDAVTPTTVFTKTNSEEAETYNLVQKKLIINQIDRTYSSLNDLEGIEIQVWIDWEQKQVGTDCWWNEERIIGYEGTTPVLDRIDADSNGEDDRCGPERFKKLGFLMDGTYRAYYGTWDPTAATSGTTPVGKFVFNIGYKEDVVGGRMVREEVELSTPVSFTPEEWIAAMDEDFDAATIEEDNNGWFRSLRGHSYGTDYEMDRDALKDPTALKVPVRSRKQINPSSELKLVCLSECFSSTSYSAYINDAITKVLAATGEDGTVGSISAASPSPWDGPKLASTGIPTGPFRRTANEWSSKGDWMSEGTLSDEIMTYTVLGSDVKDSLTNASIVVPDGIYQFPSAWVSFKNVFFNEPNGTNRRTGLHRGMYDLFLESDLAKVECPKTAKDSSNNPIYERTWDSTVDNSELLRYCRSQIQKNLNTYYQIDMETHISYRAVAVSTGLDAEITEPVAMFYDVPDDKAKFPLDYDRTRRLEYGGFGRLWGFQGTHFDIINWEDKGEYYEYSEAGSENVRFFPSFVLPDGSQVCDADNVCYKSKVYRGEYFLKPLPGETGNYTVDANSVLNLEERYTGPDVLGEAPADSTLLNNGEPSVIHGEVIVAP